MAIKQGLGEFYKSEVKKNITEQELKKYKVRIKNEDGEYEELSAKELKKYLEDMFDGGRTITLADKIMIQDGIVNSQWKRRQELLELLQQIKLGDEAADDYKTEKPA